MGANYRSACRGKATADVIAKLSLVEEETDENLYSTYGYYEAQFYPYPFPILTFEIVCVPHSRRKCCIGWNLLWRLVYYR